MNILLVTLFELFLARLDTAAFSTEYTLTITEQTSAAAAPMTSVGSIVMQGKCFRGTLFSTEAAYDGRTMYIYQPDLQELTLTQPTEDELTQTNPLLYARELYRTHPIDITMDEQTGFPKSVTLKQGTQRIRLTLRNPKWLQEAPSFVIEAPDAYLNDLR